MKIEDKVERADASRKTGIVAGVISRRGFCDALVAVAIVLGFTLLASYNRNHRLSYLTPDLIDHLGAEYDSIAHAIRAGRGFADPFHEPSGPTAWMPPVLPYFTAVLYWVTTDQREQVVSIVFTLQTMVVTWTCWLVLQVARRFELLVLGACILPIFLMMDFHELFQKTHDTWLVLFAINLLWIGLSNWHWFQRPGRNVLWGIFGGLLALVGPVLGWTWAVMTVANSLPHGMQARRKAQYLAIASLVSMVVISPWVLRNRFVLGRWIPIKSNAIYEVWQSLCHDYDGVLDLESSFEHPWLSPGVQRQRYIAEGETAFLDSFRPLVREKALSNPKALVKRSLNRWSAACVWYQPFYTYIEQPVWLLWVKRVVFALPFVGLVLVLCYPWRQSRGHVAATSGIYVLYLLPYILVSYYERYAAPLVGIKCILILSVISLYRYKLTLRSSRPAASWRPREIKSVSRIGSASGLRFK